MRVYWLTQSEEDVPPTSDWLSAEELARLDTFRFPKRKADWRLGRWTAKRAIAACLRWSSHPQILAQIEIRPTPSGAPEAILPGLTTPLAFSLSHRAGTSMCAVSSVRINLGCDLEIVEPRSSAFITDYFTFEEQSLIARLAHEDRPELLALLWSAKESALKALGQGLRVDTRSVAVTVLGQPDISGWCPLLVHSTDSQVFQGWWRKNNEFLLTVVSEPDAECPIALRTSSPALDGEDFSNLVIGADTHLKAA
jgi:4'-phosphopantetheinyl transferase